MHIQLGYSLPVDRALRIDDVNLSQRTTFAPKKCPTLSPTKPETIGPTLQPTIRTNAPTTSNVISCPPHGESITLVAGSVILTSAPTDSLCTVSMLEMTNGDVEVTVPLARSYNGFDWEISAGEKVVDILGTKDFLCYQRGCQIVLPFVSNDMVYKLSSYTYTLDMRDEYARFLETATYGITVADLNGLEEVTGNREPLSVITEYIESQMNQNETPMTSHREYWRRRANPRVSIDLSNH